MFFFLFFFFPFLYGVFFFVQLMIPEVASINYHLFLLEAERSVCGGRLDA